LTTFTIAIEAYGSIDCESNPSVGISSVFVNWAGAGILETTVPGSLDSCAFAVLVLQDLEQRFSLVLLQEIKFEVEDDV
jgi:hypothetical protein